MEEQAETSATEVQEPVTEAPAVDSRPTEEVKESPTESLVKEYADDPRVAPHLRRQKETPERTEEVKAGPAEETEKEETPKKNHSERRVEKLREEVQEALKARAELRRELEELRAEREKATKPVETKKRAARTEEIAPGVQLAFDDDGSPLKPDPKDFVDEAGDFDYAAHAAAMGAYGAELRALQHKKSSVEQEQARFARELDASRDAFSKAEAAYAKENPGYVEAAKRLLPLLVDGEEVDGDFIPSGGQRNEILSMDIVRRKDPRLLEYLAEQPAIVRTLVRVRDPQTIIQTLDEVMDDLDGWAKSRKAASREAKPTPRIPVTPSPRGASAGGDTSGAFTASGVKGKSQAWLRENADNINKAIAAGTFYR